jgi:hypothetical protein
MLILQRIITLEVFALLINIMIPTFNLIDFYKFVIYCVHEFINIIFWVCEKLRL